MSTEPTIGALKAAEKIQTKINAMIVMAGVIPPCLVDAPPGPAQLAARTKMALVIDEETGAAELLAACKDLLFAAENVDETGYVTDVGFVDLEAIYTKARAAIAKHDAANAE